MFIEQFIIFFFALVILLAAAKALTTAGVQLSKRLGISEFVIGLTIISVSTSLPELFASIAASFVGQSALIIGDVVGSNIANIGLVLAIGTLLVAIETTKNHYTRDGVFLLFTTFLFFIFASNGRISGMEGIILLLLFVFYLMVLYVSRKDESFHFGKLLHPLFGTWGMVTVKNYTVLMRKYLQLKTYQQFFYRRFQVGSLIRERLTLLFIQDIVMALLSGIAMSLAAKFVVSSAISMGDVLGVSHEIIGMTFLAVGTSLPELGVTLVSARRGLSNILLGNVVGSNISNILLIVGVSSVIRPLEVSVLSIIFLIPFLLFFTGLLVFFIRSDWLTRALEGVFFLLLYVLFMVSMLFWIGAHF